VVLAGCDGYGSSSSADFEWCGVKGKTCPVEPETPERKRARLAREGIVIDNATDEELGIEYRDESFGSASELSVDRVVIDGTAPVPIATDLFGEHAHQRWLLPGDAIAVGMRAHIVDGATSRVGFAAIVRFASSPALFVIGRGSARILKREGTYVLEAEDPKTLAIQTADPKLRRCSGDDYFAYPPFTYAIDGVAAITSVERRDNGCRALHLVGDGRESDLGLCLPSRAWPFAEDEPVFYERLPAHDDVQAGIRLRGRSVSLKIVTLRFATRESTSVDGLRLGVLPEPTCHGDGGDRGVTVPVTVQASAGNLVERVSLGHPIDDASDARRTFYVVDAAMLVVTRLTSEQENGLRSRYAAVAVVEREE
jgi:hypothetical protein